MKPGRGLALRREALTELTKLTAGELAQAAGAAPPTFQYDCPVSLHRYCSWSCTTI